MTDKLRYQKKNPFVIITHDFIKCDLLTWNEKDIYIILLMYANNEKKCFPSIATLCNVSGKANKTVIKALKGLEEKKLLKSESRITKNGQTSNLYTLYDFEDIWKAKDIKQVTEIIDMEEKRKQLYELAKELNYTIVKEKEPETLSASQSNNVSSPHDYNPSDKINTIPNFKESQEPERYTIDMIHQLFYYDIMLIDYPDKQRDIDSVMDILYTAMNTTKSTIRIAGEDKPTMVVIGKLMKLNKDSILYVIEKFSRQTERIKNPLSYMLTMLYNAPEQFNLDIQNLALHNMAHWNEEEKNI